MWLPHFGFYIWFPEGKGNFEQSQKDKQTRTFYVHAVLKNSNLLKIYDSQLILKNEYFKKLIIPKEDEIEFKFENNEDKKLKSIACKLQSQSYYLAAKKAYNHISFLLSILSFRHKYPLEIYAISIVDEKYKAKWINRPQQGKAEEFHISPTFKVNPELKNIFALYRESRNSNSPFYKFLCLFKILEAFHKHKQVFRLSDKILKENKVTIKRPKRRVSKNQIKIALLQKRNQEFEGKTYGQMYKNILCNERLMVAHIIGPKNSLANTDDFETYSEFASLGNLLDLIVLDIIQDELTLWQEFKRLGIVQNVIEI